MRECSAQIHLCKSARHSPRGLQASFCVQVAAFRSNAHRVPFALNCPAHAVGKRLAQYFCTGPQRERFDWHDPRIGPIRRPENREKSSVFSTSTADPRKGPRGHLNLFDIDHTDRAGRLTSSQVLSVSHRPRRSQTLRLSCPDYTQTTDGSVELPLHKWLWTSCSAQVGTRRWLCASSSAQVSSVQIAVCD